jgi:hypothetical protein
VVTYTRTRPFVARVNDVGGDVAALLPPPPKEGEEGQGDGVAEPAAEPAAEPSSDAVVGGSTGA